MELRVPGLMTWQICVLSAVMGVVASRYPLAGALCGGLFLLVAGGRKLRISLVLALCLACGLAAGWGSVTQKPPRISESASSWLEHDVAQRMEGVVADVAGLTDRRLRISLEKVRPVGYPEHEAAPGLVNWTWDQGAGADQAERDPGDGPRPLPGQRVTLSARIRPVHGFANRGLPSFEDYWAERDVWYNTWTRADSGQVRIDGEAGYGARLRESWRQAMVAALREDGLDQGGMSQGQAILPALIFGDRYHLDSGTFTLFSRAGLVHSLALSGQHLGLAALAATMIVWLLTRSHSAILLRLPRRTLILCLGLPLAAFYLWLGNAPPSLVRAAVMLLMGVLLWLRHKAVTLLDLLFLTVFCFLAVRPSGVWDLSLQLSVLSVLGIALSLPFQRRMAQVLQSRFKAYPALSRVLTGAALLFGTSLAVQISTLPVVIYHFGSVTPFFALNLIWLPVLGLVVLPGAALGLLCLAVPFLSPLSSLLFRLAAWPGDAMIALLQALHEQHALPLLQSLKPTALSTVGLACAIAALAVLLGRTRSRAGVILALAALILLPCGALERDAAVWSAHREQRVLIRLLDVGQGQALALEWPQGRLLLDAGGMLSPRMDSGRDMVAHALTLNRPPRLDTAMVSHGDLDHLRGMSAILELFSVDEFVHSAYPLRDTPDRRRMEDARQRRGIPLRTVASGDRLDLGSGLALEILHPPARGRFSSNNASIVARLTRHGKGLALLCGDAEIPALKRILREKAPLDAQVLIIPHHGSAQSLSPEFYDAVKPELALISVGAYNRFGFPKTVILDALQARGIRIMTSARYGEISVEWNREGRVIRTARP